MDGFFFAEHSLGVETCMIFRRTAVWRSLNHQDGNKQRTGQPRLALAIRGPVVTNEVKIVVVELVNWPCEINARDDFHMHTYMHTYMVYLIKQVGKTLSPDVDLHSLK